MRLAAKRLIGDATADGREPAGDSADTVEAITVLTLPTRGGAPLPSPELAREEASVGRAALRAGTWRIPTVGVDPESTAAWLRRLDVLLRQLPDPTAAIGGQALLDTLRRAYQGFADGTASDR